MENAFEIATAAICAVLMLASLFIGFSVLFLAAAGSYLTIPAVVVAITCWKMAEAETTDAYERW